MSHRKWRWAAVWAAALGITIGVATLGCEESPKHKLTNAKQALASGEIDRAERHLEAAIEAEPDGAEARRMMANIHMRRGEFELAEQTLQMVWEQQGFDREGELSADQRQVRQLINEQFSKLYRQWAESIDPAESPDRFEEIGRTGLKRNSRDSHLNTMMVEFYEQRAARFVERNERVKAAEQLELIDELHRFPDSRRDARERADELRKEAFYEAARERFRQEMKPDLIESGALQRDSETIRMTIESPVDHDLEPDDDEAVERARTTAVQALMPAISQLAATLADSGSDEVSPAVVEIPKLSIESEEFQAGDYEAIVNLELEDLLEVAFALAERQRKGGGDELFEDAAEVVIGDDLRLDTDAVD